MGKKLTQNPPSRPSFGSKVAWRPSEKPGVQANRDIPCAFHFRFGGERGDSSVTVGKTDDIGIGGCWSW